MIGYLVTFKYNNNKESGVIYDKILKSNNFSNLSINYYIIKKINSEEIYFIECDKILSIGDKQF